MTLLLLDSSSDQLSIAIATDAAVQQQTQTSARQHSQHLLALLQQVCVAAAVHVTELTAVVVGHGPGQFTGIRLALAAAQALAFAADAPVVSLSSLQLLAQTAYDQQQIERAYVWVDARMRQCYFAEYALDAASLMQPIQVDVMYPIAAADTLLTRTEQAVLGDWQQQVDQAPSFADIYPSAASAVGLARAAIAAGQTLDPTQLEANYLYKSNCWKKS